MGLSLSYKIHISQTMLPPHIPHRFKHVVIKSLCVEEEEECGDKEKDGPQVQKPRQEHGCFCQTPRQEPRRCSCWVLQFIFPACAAGLKGASSSFLNIQMHLPLEPNSSASSRNPPPSLLVLVTVLTIKPVVLKSNDIYNHFDVQSYKFRGEDTERRIVC